jgi:hypothetical protein
VACLLVRVHRQRQGKQAKQSPVTCTEFAFFFFFFFWFQQLSVTFLDREIGEMEERDGYSDGR